MRVVRTRVQVPTWAQCCRTLSSTPCTTSWAHRGSMGPVGCRGPHRTGERHAPMTGGPQGRVGPRGRLPRPGRRSRPRPRNRRQACRQPRGRPCRGQRGPPRCAWRTCTKQSPRRGRPSLPASGNGWRRSTHASGAEAAILCTATCRPLSTARPPLHPLTQLTIHMQGGTGGNLHCA
jgi:hypothetical protein